MIGRLPVIVRRMIQVIWDALSWLLAVMLLVGVRYDFSLTPDQWSWALAYSLCAIVLQVTFGLLSQVYLGRNRTGSFTEATWVGAMLILVATPLAIVFPLVSSDFPRGIGVVAPMLTLCFMALGRWAFRMIIAAGRKSTVGGAPALVYGAGDAGHEVARLIATAEEPPYRIVGFLDDAPGKGFLRVGGHRVRGTGEDLLAVAAETEAEVVILAISNASAKLIQSVSDRCRKAGLKLVVLPPVREMIGGRVTLASLREFNVADLLGRRPIKTDLSRIADSVQGRVVLITGAGGSIGAELARQVYKLGPSKLVLLDRDESALHGVQLSLYGSGLLDTDDMVLCDIRDQDALRAVFQEHRPELVFHAAALKHLPMLERFPVEGWKTNVLGTLNVLKCAHEAGGRQFVNISTDKAADATSVLGQTKRLAERLTAWFAQTHGTTYLSVRFGNVLGSRGSVLYAFRAQIERGDAVTVTHPDVTRYFMTIPEACELVLQASVIGRPGDVLVLDMGEPVKIVDVAQRLIEESGKDVKIRYTGLRHGEKLHEVLFSTLEKGRPSDHPLISQVAVPVFEPVDLPFRNEDAALRLLADQSRTDAAEAAAPAPQSSVSEAVV
ncbi:MAG: polysaccharide biosynthesis protein [Nigerium sp.]|nr:polysaccharide biosynthesis protein [Nigerium sp.]